MKKKFFFSTLFSVLICARLGFGQDVPTATPLPPPGDEPLSAKINPPKVLQPKVNPPPPAYYQDNTEATVDPLAVNPKLNKPIPTNRQPEKTEEIAEPETTKAPEIEKITPQKTETKTITEPEELKMATTDCLRLMKSHPVPADYQPGVDARGRSVVPADSGGATFLPKTFTIDVTHDIRPLLKLSDQQKSYLGDGLKVGTIAIGLDGSVRFNGMPIGSAKDAKFQALLEACKKRINGE